MKSKLKSLALAYFNELKFPFMSVILAFVIGAIFVLWTGNSPIVAYSALFRGAFGGSVRIANTILASIPLMLTGLAISFAFRCGLFNIGAEGQYIVGSIGAVVSGYFFRGLPPIILVPIVLITGAIFGGIWAGIAGFLKAKRGTHEVIVTIMLNYVAFHLSNYLTRTMLNPSTLIEGAARDPKTVAIGVNAHLPKFANFFDSLRTTDLHFGIFISIVAALVVYFILWKTVLGYEIRAVGFNSSAAEYGGINVKKNIIMAMAISGILAGLAGAVQVSGLNHRVDVLLAFTNYGFDGIAVALVGKNHPIGVILSSILFAALSRGSSQMQIAGIPREITGIIQGVIIILVTADQIIKWILRTKKNKASKEGI